MNRTNIMKQREKRSFKKDKMNMNYIERLLLVLVHMQFELKTFIQLLSNNMTSLIKFPSRLYICSYKTRHVILLAQKDLPC